MIKCCLKYEQCSNQSRQERCTYYWITGQDFLESTNIYLLVSTLHHREEQTQRTYTNHLPSHMRKITYQILSSFDLDMRLAHIKETLFFSYQRQHGGIRAMYVARQQSLISNALFLTFASTCHYQKGLDFTGLTFKP